MHSSRDDWGSHSVSSIQKKHGHTGKSAVKGHEYGKGTGIFVIRGEAKPQGGKTWARGEPC